MVQRVVLEFTGVAGSPAYQTLHFDDTLTPGDVADTLVDYALAVQSLLSSNATLRLPAFLTEVDTATGQVTGVSSLTYTGGITAYPGQASGMLPKAAQIVVSLTTGIYVSGRQIRGRLFLPYLGDAMVDSAGLVSGVAAGFAADAANALATGGLVVYSETYSQAPVVGGVIVDTEFGVLRSRRD